MHCIIESGMNLCLNKFKFKITKILFSVNFQLILLLFQWMFLKQKFERTNLTFQADGSNLIDDIWKIPQGRAPESATHIFIHDVKYAGKILFAPIISHSSLIILI